MAAVSHHMKTQASVDFEYRIPQFMRFIRKHITLNALYSITKVSPLGRGFSITQQYPIFMM